jgi:hypothetical protein
MVRHAPFPEDFDELENPGELLQVRGLGHERVGMAVVGRGDVLLPVRYRQNHDGDVPECRIALEIVEDFPPALSRQVPVEQDDVGPKPCCERSRASACSPSSTTVMRDRMRP